jgi:choline dehydrogenase
MTASERADVIVVGAGTAGSVVARRLVDAGHRVAVIEAGPRDDRPEIDSPFTAAALLGSEFDWNFSTVPQTAAQNRVLNQPRGKALGGTTVFYGMLYIRGAPNDYDAWAAEGASGWAWRDVEPYFRRLESYDGPASDARGVSGPLHVHRNTDPDPLVRAFLNAAVQAGYPYNDDYNAGDSHGASFAQATVKDGHRVTAWRAYTTPCTDSPLLRIVTDALVTKVLVASGRAVGVEYERGGERHVIYAEKEIVLCTGVFGTPQLLMLSGIGNADELRSHRVAVVQDLPGVGRNLCDHVMSSVVWESRLPVPAPRMTGIEAQIIADSGRAPIEPDRQAIFMSFIFSALHENLPERGFTGLAVTLHPYSRGDVRLRSADPRDPPLIDLRILSDKRDLESVVDHIETLREIARQPALAEWIESEAYPGPDRITREALRDYVRASADSGHHQVGTARMGTDQLAVVDPELRVYGVKGLRIADASVMPRTTAGNTAAPTLMIAERAADFLLMGV